MSKLNAAAKEWTPPASTGLRVSLLFCLLSFSNYLLFSLLHKPLFQPLLLSHSQRLLPQLQRSVSPLCCSSPSLSCSSQYPQYNPYYSGYPPYGYDSYGYQIQPMGMVYDPTVGIVPAVAIAAPHYEGHKSRSNSLTHHDAPHSNHKYPAVHTPAVASAAPIPTPAASSNPSAKVEEPTSEIKVPEASSSTAAAAPSTDATAVDTVSTENTVTPATATEGKIEQEGWARGKALIVEQPIERQNLENHNNPEAGPSPWKRGISMSEKTPAQMLLRQDGITRYSRETIITLHIVGSHPVPSEIFGLYGVKYTANERVECKPLTVNSVAAKSPNKGGGRRDGGKGGRHNELIDEPHPDEKTFFVEKNENAFRFVSLSLPALLSFSRSSRSLLFSHFSSVLPCCLSQA
jgi:hypothetical protein